MMLRMISLVLVMVTTLACSHSREDRTRHRRVILILLDAARVDRFGYAGYPKATTPVMDELGKTGLVFRNHYAHATHTRASLPNLLYSRYFVPNMFPSSSSVPFDSPKNLMRKIDDEAISLPRALEKHGFKTAVISAHSWIKSGTRFAEEFQELQDLPEEFHRYAPPAKIVIGRALLWIDQHRDDDFFLYLHLMDTHFPHGFSPDAQEFFGAPTYKGKRVTGGVGSQDTSQALTGEDRRYMDALYDGSLRSADRQIGQLITYLRQEGMLEDTLIAITADHGDHLLEFPGRFTHGGPWLETLAHIPWIISFPKRIKSAHVIDNYSSLIDVEPTLLALLGLSVASDKRFDGIDQFAVLEERGEKKERVLSKNGIRTQRYKLLVGDYRKWLENDTVPSVEDLSGSLYDLGEDPNELHDLWHERPDVVEQLTNQFHTTLRLPYKRFTEAANHDQPRVPFAISAGYFETRSPLPAVRRGAKRTGAETEVGSSKWFRVPEPSPGAILSSSNASPLEITFPLPNGNYEVIVQSVGRGTIQLDGRGVTQLGKVASAPRRIDRTRAGVARVDKERFKAVFSPSSDGEGLRVDMLGFRPLDREGKSSEVDEEHLKQLRALGYVE